MHGQALVSKRYQISLELKDTENELHIEHVSGSARQEISINSAGEMITFELNIGKDDVIEIGGFTNNNPIAGLIISGKV